MELIDLKIFQAVAEEGSATMAAIRLAMTQPGVSQHLKRLEERVGVRLFDRVKNRLVLNSSGRALLEKAKRILIDVENIGDLEGEKNVIAGTLRLGLTDASTQTIIPPKLKEFRERYSGVHVELIVSESEEIEDGVIRGKYDMGVISGIGMPHPLLEENVIDSDRIDALVSSKGPLAGLKKISAEELVKRPLIMYPKKSRTRQIIDLALRQRGLVPKEVIDVWYIGAAVRLAEAGLGVAMLSHFFIKNELMSHKCSHLRITGDPFKRNICVIKKKGAILSEPATLFYELLMGR